MVVAAMERNGKVLEIFQRTSDRPLWKRDRRESGRRLRVLASEALWVGMLGPQSSRGALLGLACHRPEGHILILLA